MQLGPNAAKKSLKLSHHPTTVERVTPIQNNIGPPSIRLCLIHPGRGRAARRRTAANSQDAIETREGGWCWTSQTAIGWGPLPKRALRGSVFHL